MKDLLSDIDWDDVCWAFMQTLFAGLMAGFVLAGICGLIYLAIISEFSLGVMVGSSIVVFLFIGTFLFYRKENPPKKKDRW